MKTTIEFLPTRKSFTNIGSLEPGDFFLGSGHGIETDAHLCVITVKNERLFNFTINGPMLVTNPGAFVTPVNVKILVDQN